MTLILPDLLDLLDQAADAAQALTAQVRAAVAERTSQDGRTDRRRLDAEQHAAHGLAWMPAYAATLRQTPAWARALGAAGRFGEAEALPAQLLAGVPTRQGETFRTWEVGVRSWAIAPLVSRVAPGATPAVRAAIVELLDAARGHPSLETSGLDETLEAIRDQFQAFASEKSA